MPLLIIWGCGGHARSVTDIVLGNAPSRQIVFVDEAALPGEKIWGFEVFKELIGNYDEYFCAYGDNNKRKEIIERNGIKRLTNIISNKSHIGKLTKLSKGIFVGYGTHLGPEVNIGIGTIVNTNAVIEHETKIGSYCHVAPNATICGRCRIGDNVFLGTGSIVKDNITIAPNITIGAGSVVVEDIITPGIYAGTPAKKISS